MSQDDPHDPHARSAQQSPTTSDTVAPRTDLVAADAQTARLPGEPREAAKEFFETALGMSVQSGPSVSIAAFGALPESTQKQYLENSAQRDRLNFERDSRGFDLEEKQIDAQMKESDAQRTHELAKLDRTLAHQERDTVRRTWFAGGAVSAAVAVAVLCLFLHEVAIATHLFTALGSSGLTYLGIKKVGRSRARQQTKRLPKGQHSDDE